MSTSRARSKKSVKLENSRCVIGRICASGIGAQPTVNPSHTVPVVLTRSTLLCSETPRGHRRLHFPERVAVEPGGGSLFDGGVGSKSPANCSMVNWSNGKSRFDASMTQFAIHISARAAADRSGNRRCRRSGPRSSQCRPHRSPKCGEASSVSTKRSYASGRRSCRKTPVAPVSRKTQQIQASRRRSVGPVGLRRGRGEFMLQFSPAQRRRSDYGPSVCCSLGSAGSCGAVKSPVFRGRGFRVSGCGR